MAAPFSILSIGCGGCLPSAAFHIHVITEKEDEVLCSSPLHRKGRLLKVEQGEEGKDKEMITMRGATDEVAPFFQFKTSQ